jgi:hypothetical protein
LDGMAVDPSRRFELIAQKFNAKVAYSIASKRYSCSETRALNKVRDEPRSRD